jgi:diguanylate cyclase (GGDEF)-like protein
METTSHTGRPSRESTSTRAAGRASGRAGRRPLAPDDRHDKGGTCGKFGSSVGGSGSVLGGGGWVLVVLAGWVGAAGVVLAIRAGLPVWVVLLVGSMVGERVVAGRRHRRELAAALRLAHVDDLTGLANRRALHAALSETLHAGGAMSLVLVDPDDFKAVNDTYGHAAGDVVLREVAARLADVAADEGALAARLGGDEFAVLTGQQDPARLRGLARRVRAAAGKPVRVSAARVRVGASVGTTTRAPRDEAPTDLLTRADLAMYLTKTTRRRAGGRVKAARP